MILVLICGLFAILERGMCFHIHYNACSLLDNFGCALAGEKTLPGRVCLFIFILVFVEALQPLVCSTGTPVVVVLRHIALR